MVFGDRLREMRLRKGLTQQQLAQQIGVAKSTLTGYEKGNREPDVFKIKRILEVLEADSDYLLGVSREPEQKEATTNNPESCSYFSDDLQKNEKVLLTDSEIILVDSFRALDTDSQKYILGVLDHELSRSNHIKGIHCL